jgi:putative hydrolase of the HAD superfamily
MSFSDKRVNIYKVLFFDLDRTLWDYRANSEQTLNDLVKKHTPHLIEKFDEFLAIFYEVNESLWLEYRDGRLSKERLSTQRFIDSFKRLGVDAESFAGEFSVDYITESPNKTKLFPETIETLTYLKKAGYRLFLLTNGFVEVQNVKIRYSKLETFFERMITSEEAGFQKPHEKIFEFALNIVKTEKPDCLMIGDDLESDIMGAQNFGIDTVFFNQAGLKHTSTPTFEIRQLDELRLFL